MMRRSGCVGVAVALACSGCGTDSDGEGRACERFSACGGDPVGVWTSREVCANGGLGTPVLGLPDECARAFSVRSASADTTLTIGDDGSVSESGTVAITWQMEFDATCVEAFTEMPVDAEVVAGFCDAFPDALTTSESPFTLATCTASADACSCDAEQVSEVVTSGSVEVVGTELISPSGARSSFCADRDELSLEVLVGDLRMVNVYSRAR